MLRNDVEDRASTIVLGAEDPISELMTFVAKHPHIDTLHIVSHGSPGEIHLGGKDGFHLCVENMGDYPGLMGLSRVRHVYLYGCNVAAGERGQKFLLEWVRRTGASISASVNSVGNIALGGAWELPVTVYAHDPEIAEDQLIFSGKCRASYPGLFGEGEAGETGAGERNSGPSPAATSDLYLSGEGGDVEVKNPTALVNAFERQKQENRDLKGQIDQLTKVLQQVQDGLGSHPQPQPQPQPPLPQPHDASSVLKTIEEFNLAQQLKERDEATAAKARQQAEQEYATQIQKVTQQYQAADQEIAGLIKRQLLSGAYGYRGLNDGIMNVYDGAIRFFEGLGYEFVLDRESATIPEIRHQGKPLKADPGKDKAAMGGEIQATDNLTPAAFFHRCRRGEYGTPAQAFFTPLTQAQGTGTAPIRTTSDGTLHMTMTEVMQRQQTDLKFAEKWPSLQAQGKLVVTTG
jgi:hypothetical protein